MYRGIRSLQLFRTSRASRRLAAISRRGFAVEAAEAYDVYEHAGTMSTEDLFQFEPFNDQELLKFPRERPGLDYALNWSLSGEWITVWGDAYRNPEKSVLREKIVGSRDKDGNVVCARTYSEDATPSKVPFEDICEEAKEFISAVPNLYVEDAAVGSGRGIETRIRSVTNDPVTAFVMKNMLHRLPLRHPQTPHPLSLIVARGMKSSVMAIGQDPFSKSLAVVATGATPVKRILEGLATAAAMQFDEDRGFVEMTVPASEPGKPETKMSVKDKLSKCIIQGATVINKEGVPVVVFGLEDEMKEKLFQEKRIYCESNSIVSTGGLSRLYGAITLPAQAKVSTKPSNELLLNDLYYVRVPADNIVNFPRMVVFVTPGASGGEVEDDHAARLIAEKGSSEEESKFVLSTLKANGAVFKVMNPASVMEML